jgi:hypothetical protein
MTKYIFLYFILLFKTGIAQSTKELVDKGHSAYVKGDFEVALQHYGRVLNFDPMNFDAALFTGIIFYSRGNYEDAINYLNRCLQSSSNSTPLYYIAECNFYLERYDQASEYYSNFLIKSHSDFDLVQRASDQLRNAKFAVAAFHMPVPQFRIPDWLKGLSSDADDYNPWLAEDGTLFFCSDRYLDRDYDLFKSKWLGSSYSSPERISEPLSTPDDETELSVTGNGSVIVFTSSNWCPPLTNCMTSYKIKIAFLSRGIWSNPRIVSDNICYYSVSDSGSGRVKWIFDESIANPALSVDGKSLFFASKRPGGMGGFDLWVSILTDTGWARPYNLGPAINTPGNEADPCLLPDGKTLFFSSSGHPGFGGYDFFVSFFSGGQWSSPANLGKPFNTSEDEFDLFVHERGMQFWFNRGTISKRNPKRRIRQLHVIELIEPLQVLQNNR